MKLKKAVMAGAATALFVGSVLNVSAAKTASDNYVNALKESNKENLILDVEAYKAAYSDLAAAFGDDTDAYIEHYLTIGIYEGRTKGVLFDPLAYAEAYNDVKSVCGYNIPAIIDHYLTFGIAENRTAGTANGYADIAEAEKNGAAKISVQRDLAKISNASSSADAYNASADPVNAASDNTNTATNNSNNTTAATSSPGTVISSNPKTNAAANANVTANTGTGTASNTNSTVPANNNTGNTAGSNPVTAPTAPGNNTGNTSSDNYTAPTVDNSTASNEISGYVPPQNNNNYHHTTSIYDNDESTLIRVEYYDENNKLFEFSEVSNHDSDSNSYTEDVYYTDQETGEIVHDRTDTYVNGALSSSEKH